MPVKVRQVDYFYFVVEDRLGEGVRVFEELRNANVNLIAFTAFPVGVGQIQMDFFPENTDKFLRGLGSAGANLIGPKKAFLIQGPDRVGAIVELHRQLAMAGITAYAANGVSDGRGGFGYVLWVKQEHYERASVALGAESA